MKFRKFHILPLTSQYLLYLLMFVLQHKNLETRQSNNLSTPRANLSIKKEPWR
jgi:hypothetical protein